MLDWLIDKLCANDRVGWGSCRLAILLYIKHGGHLIITRSAGHPLIPHICWTDQLPPTLIRHFIPLKRKKGWRAMFKWMLFKGRWQTRVIRARRPADGATGDAYDAKKSS